MRFQEVPKTKKTWNLATEYKGAKEYNYYLFRRILVQGFNVNLENKRKIRTVNSLSHLELATCHSLHFKSDTFG